MFKRMMIRSVSGLLSGFTLLSAAAVAAPPPSLALPPAAAIPTRFVAGEDAGGQGAVTGSAAIFRPIAHEGAASEGAAGTAAAKLCAVTRVHAVRL